MNNNKLEILVTAKDAASNIIQGVGKTFRSMGTNAVAGAKAGAAALAAVGAAAVAYGASSVKAYFSAAEASTKLATNILNVKGNTDKQVSSLENLASKMQSYGVIEDDAIKAGMSQLATFNLQAKSIATLTPKIADMAAQMKGHNATAEDMAGLNNLVGKVMTGNVGALSRYGVTLSETSKEILTNGTEAERAAELTKVLGQNYGEVNKKLRETPQGVITGLKNDFGDLQEGVGEMLVQAILPLAKGFSNWMVQVNEAGGMMEYFKQKIDENKEAVIAIAGAITAILVVALAAWLVPLAPIIAGMIGVAAVGAALAVGINALAQKFGGWGVVMKTAGDIGKQAFTVLQSVVAFLMPSLTALWEAFSQQLLPTLQQLWNTIAPVLIPVLQTLGVILGAVIVGAIWLLINALKIGINILSFLVMVIDEVLKAIGTVVLAIVDFGIKVVQSAGKAWNGIVSFFGGMPGWFNTKISQVKAFFNSIPGFLAGVFRAGYNNVRNAFAGIGGFFQGIWNTVTGIFRRVGTAIGNAVGGSVKNVVNSILGFAERTINGFINAINGAIDLINKIPGVNIGKLSTLSIPKFRSGVENFGGGMAYVHQGEMLANLPKGTNVFTKAETAAMMGKSGGATNYFYGNIYLNSKEAVDRFVERINRDNELAQMGGAV